MMESIFHVVTEDHQIEHVSYEMCPSCVHKHRSEECSYIPYGIIHESAGNESPFHNEGFPSIEFDEEKQDVYSD